MPLLSNSYLPGAQPEMDFSIVDFGKNQNHQEVHSPSSWTGTFEREDRESLSNTFSSLGKNTKFYKMLQHSILITPSGRGVIFHCIKDKTETHTNKRLARVIQTTRH